MLNCERDFVAKKKKEKEMEWMLLKHLTTILLRNQKSLKKKTERGRERKREREAEGNEMKSIISVMQYDNFNFSKIFHFFFFKFKENFLTEIFFLFF